MIATSLLFGYPATGAAIFGILVPVLNMIMGGIRLATAASFTVILATPIALVSGLNPLSGAALMAVACLGAGVSAGWGLQRGLSMLPMAIAFLLISPPVIDGQPADPTSNSYLLAVMAVMAMAALFPLAVLPLLLRGRSTPPPQRNSRADSIDYAIIIATLTALATGAVLMIDPGTNAFWLILTLLVIVQVGPQATVRKTLSRSGGTLLGGAIAASLVILLPNPTAIFILGVISLLLTLNFAGGQRYWLYTACLTPTIVFMSGDSAAETAARERVLYTLMAAALALLAFAIARLAHHWSPAGTREKLQNHG